MRNGCQSAGTEEGALLQLCSFAARQSFRSPGLELGQSGGNKLGQNWRLYRKSATSSLQTQVPFRFHFHFELHLRLRLP